MTEKQQVHFARRGLYINYAILGTAIITLGTIVWEGAGFYNGVEEMKKMINDQKIKIEQHTTKITDHETRLTVLEKINK